MFIAVRESTHATAEPAAHTCRYTHLHISFYKRRQTNHTFLLRYASQSASRHTLQRNKSVHTCRYTHLHISFYKRVQTNHTCLLRYASRHMLQPNQQPIHVDIHIYISRSISVGRQITLFYCGTRVSPRVGTRCSGTSQSIHVDIHIYISRSISVCRQITHVYCGMRVGTRYSRTSSPYM